MTTFLNLLMLLLVVSLASVALLSVVLGYRIQIRLTKIFSERLGIPSINTEVSPPKEIVKPKQDNRPRIHVQVPGMQMFKPQTDKKQ
jgi:hypothetical protein